MNWVLPIFRNPNHVETFTFSVREYGLSLAHSLQSFGLVKGVIEASFQSCFLPVVVLTM